MAGIQYNDSELRAMFAELEPKNRRKVFRAALGQAATKVRRAAVGYLRQSLRISRDGERGIRKIVYKTQAGFKITVIPSGRGARAKGYHRNRQGKEKPVLMWAEEGTDRRSTKNRGWIWRRRRGHDTGRMKGKHFLGQAARDMDGPVTDFLHEKLKEQTVKIAQKHGAR